MSDRDGDGLCPACFEEGSLGGKLAPGKLWCQNSDCRTVSFKTGRPDSGFNDADS